MSTKWKIKDERRAFQFNIPVPVWDDIQEFRETQPSETGGTYTFTGAALSLIQRGLRQWRAEKGIKK